MDGRVPRELDQVAIGNGTDGKLIQVCVRGSNEYHALKIPRLTHCTDLDIKREHTILKRVQGHPCMVEIVGVYTGDAPWSRAQAGGLVYVHAARW